MNSDPLSIFAVPGVLDEANKVLRQAWELIQEAYPDEPADVLKDGLGRAFQALNLRSDVYITAQALMAEYEATRQRR